MEIKTLKTGNTREINIRKKMSDNIPFEMQVEIMKRLPAKSLAVFRSASKAWKSVIDSRLFIADYTNFHQHHRLLIWNGVNIFESEYVSIIMDNETLSQHNLTNVPAPLEQLQNLSFIGTSKGLLCFSGYSREVGCKKETAVIWNPSLGKSIAIDLPGRPYVLGFGVRPDNCEPMIVLMNYDEHPYPAMVFTLSSRVWRVPRGSQPSKSISYNCWYPVVATDDQHIYGKAYEFRRSINLVVAFDMVSEDFTEIHLPHSVAHRESHRFSISKIKESLALLEYDDDDDDKPVCNVWMMVEDGFSKSFTKLFTINTPSLYTDVLGFRKNDQPIMATTTDEYRSISVSLEVYEPHAGTIKNLGIIGARYKFYLSSYTETLLLLDQLDKQVVKISYDDSDISVETIYDYIKSFYVP